MGGWAPARRFRAGSCPATDAPLRLGLGAKPPSDGHRPPRRRGGHDPSLRAVLAGACASLLSRQPGGRTGLLPGGDASCACCESRRNATRQPLLRVAAAVGASRPRSSQPTQAADPAKSPRAGPLIGCLMGPRAPAIPARAGAAVTYMTLYIAGSPV